MKLLHIKAWPEMLSYLPSVSPFQLTSDSKHDIYIDFSGCQQVDSCGLTVFLLRVMKLILEASKLRCWDSDNLTENPVFHTICQLGFFHLIKEHAIGDSLLAAGLSSQEPSSVPVYGHFYGRTVISYPIFCLDFSKSQSDRRIPINSFRKLIKERLSELQKKYVIHVNQLIAVLTEMAKNSADHTDNHAYFGLDIEIVPESESARVHFVFGDLGTGIKQHIQNYLPPEISKSRGSHWSLYESYYFALKQGYTSSRDKNRNQGLGMSIILDGSKGIDMHLSVFDASSRGVLSALEEPSHEQLRRQFYAFARDRCFYYYGTLEAKSK